MTVPMKMSAILAYMNLADPWLPGAELYCKHAMLWSMTMFVCMHQGAEMLCACIRELTFCVHVSGSWNAVCMCQGPYTLCACITQLTHCVHASGSLNILCMLAHN